jgi:hypothetical protein
MQEEEFVECSFDGDFYHMMFGAHSLLDVVVTVVVVVTAAC